jgi:hypothetical protein
MGNSLNKFESQTRRIVKENGRETEGERMKQMANLIDIVGQLDASEVETLVVSVVMKDEAGMVQCCGLLVDVQAAVLNVVRILEETVENHGKEGGIQ